MDHCGTEEGGVTIVYISPLICNKWFTLLHLKGGGIAQIYPNLRNGYKRKSFEHDSSQRRDEEWEPEAWKPRDEKEMQ